MIILALALALSFQDPANDANGDGSLRAPTAAVYRSSAALDITEFELLESDTLGFALTFSSLGNPHDLPNGFSLPIIEIYIENADDTAGPGVAELLPGSGMSLPDGESWHYAFQLTGDALRVFAADANGNVEDISENADSDLSVSGAVLELSTSLALPDTFNVFGMVGNYSAFSPTGWQPLSSQVSPWAYSSSSQRYPVVDVLASADSQVQALQTGVLPAIQTRRVAAPSYWVYIMLLGIILGIVGIVGRFRQPRTARPVRTRRANARSNPAYNPAYKPDTYAPDTKVPTIDWNAPQLNRDIAEVVASGRDHPKAPERVNAKPNKTDFGDADIIDLRKTIVREQPVVRHVAPPLKKRPLAQSETEFEINDFDLAKVIAEDEAGRLEPPTSAPPSSHSKVKVVSTDKLGRPRTADLAKDDLAKGDLAEGNLSEAKPRSIPNLPDKATPDKPAAKASSTSSTKSEPASNISPADKPTANKPVVSGSTRNRAAMNRPNTNQPNTNQPNTGQPNTSQADTTPPQPKRIPEEKKLRPEPKITVLPQPAAEPPPFKRGESGFANRVDTGKVGADKPGTDKVNANKVDIDKPDTASPAEPVQKADTADDVEIYSLKQALKKLRPKDAPSDSEDSSL